MKKISLILLTLGALFLGGCGGTDESGVTVSRGWFGQNTQIAADIDA